MAITKDGKRPMPIISSIADIINPKKIKLIVIDCLFKDRIICKDYPIFDILIQPYIEVNLNEKASAIKHLRGPDYVLLDNDLRILNKPIQYTSKDKYLNWLKEGLSNL